MVDLKNKVKQVEGLVAADTSVVQRMTTASSEVAEEAVAALVMLGFQKAASQKVVTAILKEDPAMAVEKVVKEGASQKVVTAILKEDPAMAVEKVVKEGLKRL